MKLRLISFVFIVTLLASACATKPPAPKSFLEQLPPGFIAGYVEADKNYQDLVGQENGISASYQVSQEQYNKLLTGAADQISIINSCFSNSEEAINNAAAIVFGQDASGNPLSADAQNNAFIKALGTGTGFYAGNIELCQKAELDFMSYARANRDQFYNTRVVVISKLQTYNLSLRKNLKMATVMNFYNQYGPTIAEAIRQGETKTIDAIAANNGFPEPLPLDFIGFPTAALMVQSKSKALCDGYQQYADGTLPTPGGENPLLYETQWDSVGGNCTLYRMAAYRYMSRLFVSQQAATRLDCSVDAGIGEVVGPDCQVQTATPKAP